MLSAVTRFKLFGTLLTILLLSPPHGQAQGLSDTAAVRRLEDFLRVAYATSPLLRDYAGQVRQNRLDSLRRKAENGLQVAGNAVAVAAPIVKGFGYDEVVSNGGNYGAVASVSKPILNRNILQNDYRALENQGLVLRNTRRLSELDLRRTVTDQFLTAYAAQQQWRFNEDFLGQLRDQDVLLRRLVNGGIYKQTQYLSFYLSIQTQEVAVQQSRMAYQRELGTLRYLCGLADTALRPLADPAPPPARPLAGLNAAAQRQYTLDSLRIELARRTVALSYRPRVALAADAGFMSAQPLLFRRPGISGGLTLTVPIYDGHQRQIALQRLDIDEQTRRGYRSFVTVQRRQQYDQLRELVRTADTLIANTRRQIHTAAALMEAGRQQLGTGDMTILDYLQLVTGYRTLRFSLTQAETERLRTLYTLDYLGD